MLFHALLLLSYGVGLRWDQEQRHLVLADKVAVDALLGVSAYLRTHTRPGREVFSLRDDTGRPTFDMAAEFAGGEDGEEFVGGDPAFSVGDAHDVYSMLCAS